MKKIMTWGIYFIICAVVIGWAIAAGTKHRHCDECSHAYDGKSHEKERLANKWLGGE